MAIREAVKDSDWEEVYRLLAELRTDLTREEYFQLLQQMKKEGYRVFCLYNEEEELVSLAGIIIRTNFYAKRHVFVYDLVTRQNERSKGYGRQLLQFIESWGKGQSCKTIGLDSGLQRTEAHRFYESAMGFSKSSFAFRKDISRP